MPRQSCPTAASRPAVSEYLCGSGRHGGSTGCGRRGCHPLDPLRLTRIETPGSRNRIWFRHHRSSWKSIVVENCGLATSARFPPAGRPKEETPAHWAGVLPLSDQLRIRPGPSDRPVALAPAATTASSAASTRFGPRKSGWAMPISAWVPLLGGLAAQPGDAIAR